MQYIIFQAQQRNLCAIHGSLYTIWTNIAVGRELKVLQFEANRSPVTDSNPRHVIQSSAKIAPQFTPISDTKKAPSSVAVFAYTGN